MGEPTLMKINKTTYKREGSILESAKSSIIGKHDLQNDVKKGNGTLIYIPYEKSFKL